MGCINFKEEQVTVSGKHELKGTLTIPENMEKKYPVVLIVSGSGEIDRDGNVQKMKLNTNIYKKLAEIITKLGFITLRYDKRGVGQSGGSYLKTGMWDLVDDIDVNMEFIKKHLLVDKNNIILLGHSEGCILVTAANARKPVSGLILLSGAAEPLEAALKRQRAIAYAELLDSKGFKGFLFRLTRVDKLGERQAQKLLRRIQESDADILKYNFVKMNAKWFREHLAYNVLDDLKKAACPVLAVTGSKDFQANPDRIKDVLGIAKGEVECHVIENMDHGLKEYTGPVSAINFKQQYKATTGLPVHTDLSRILSDWLERHFINYCQGRL